MNKIIFAACAALGLLLVLDGGKTKKTNIQTQSLTPSVAIEVKDDALEALRRHAIENSNLKRR